MRQTTERFVPDEAQSPDELAIALLHLYAYDTAAALVRPGERVLDVGFGEGYGSRILSIAGGKYRGLELDPVAVEHASARYEARFETYDGLSIPAEDEAFDVVVSFQVIEHVPNPTPWLAEIRRVLSRHGVAILSTPNRVYRLGDRERPWNRHHVREYTAPQFRDLLEGVFPDVALFGVCASDPIDSIVRARAARARKLARIDRLGLRYRLPEGLDTRLRRALRRARQPSADRSKLTLDRLWHDAGAAEQGLDLLAFVRRSSVH